jgi:hypothetical protein
MQRQEDDIVGTHERDSEQDVEEIDRIDEQDVESVVRAGDRIDKIDEQTAEHVVQAENSIVKINVRLVVIDENEDELAEELICREQLMKGKQESGAKMSAIVRTVPTARRRTMVKIGILRVVMIDSIRISNPKSKKKSKKSECLD